MTAAAAIAAGSAAVAAPARASWGIHLPRYRLIERFVRVRAWFLDNNKRNRAWSDEIGRRFYAATGVTKDQYREMNYAIRAGKNWTQFIVKFAAKFRVLRTTKPSARGFVMSDGKSPRPSWLTSRKLLRTLRGS
jgi:hypothetical protein